MHFEIGAKGGERKPKPYGCYEPHNWPLSIRNLTIRGGYGDKRSPLTNNGFINLGVIPNASSPIVLERNYEKEN